MITMTSQNTATQLMDIALRIRELREILGYTEQQMAEMTEISLDTYRIYESGSIDLPFTFMHKCAKAFGVEITVLLEGHSAKLSGYTVTRKGKGLTTASEDGITIQDMAPMFRRKLATPYYVTYEYDEELQDEPIHTVTHDGQEFNLILKGALRIRVGDNEEILHEGDSIFYKSSTPHGMIAIEGKDCVFLSMIMASDKRDSALKLPSQRVVKEKTTEQRLLCNEFVWGTEDENGAMTGLNYANTDRYNFAFDTVDAIARKYPDKLAMIHIGNDMTERRFTFKDMKDASSQCANYFKSLGIKRGDRVMVVLKRHYQFWYAILGLHKLGAIAIPATNQLMEHDFTYRFQAGGVSAILCTADGDTAHQVELSEQVCGIQLNKILVGGSREGWHDFNEEYGLFSRRYVRTEDAPCGDDPMLMLFTSGTTGYPKMAMHSYKYALGHYVTARYWHLCERSGLHFTMSETGWARLSGASSTASGSARAQSLPTTLIVSTLKRFCPCSHSTTSPPSALPPPCTACSSSRIFPSMI